MQETRMNLERKIMKTVHKVQDLESDYTTAVAKGMDKLFKLGQVLERKRIIKLLEGIDYLSDCCIQPDCCVTTSELIALIKGENK
jgi:hypothetical protein